MVSVFFSQILCSRIEPIHSHHSLLRALTQAWHHPAAGWHPLTHLSAMGLLLPQSFFALCVLERSSVLEQAFDHVTLRLKNPTMFVSAAFKIKGKLPSRRYKAVYHHQSGLSDLSLCLHSLQFSMHNCKTQAEQSRFPVKVRSLMALHHCLEGSVSLVSRGVPLKSNSGCLLSAWAETLPTNILIALCCEHLSTCLHYTVTSQ